MQNLAHNMSEYSCVEELYEGFRGHKSSSKAAKIRSVGKAVFRGESPGSLGPVGLPAWLTLTTVSTYTEDCSVMSNLTLAEATTL